MKDRQLSLSHHLILKYLTGIQMTYHFVLLEKLMVKVQDLTLSKRNYAVGHS